MFFLAYWLNEFLDIDKVFSSICEIVNYPLLWPESQSSLLYFLVKLTYINYHSVEEKKNMYKHVFLKVNRNKQLLLIILEQTEGSSDK